MTILDMNVFNALKESTGEDFIPELIDTFFEDAKTQMNELKSALDTKNVDTFRRAAHSFKSNAATFGATELSSLARELEMMAREGNLEVGDRLKVLNEAYEKVKTILSELR